MLDRDPSDAAAEASGPNRNRAGASVFVRLYYFEYYFYNLKLTSTGFLDLL